MPSRRIDPHPDCPECKGTGKCQSCDGLGDCDDCHEGDGECQRCDATAAEIEKYGPHE